ncbi:MAG: hypothetical protein GIW98_01730 [Candidatus Eremiobacteraeota bacterium]|nr:hypothetical protein [Candidatus Eremiobacteraeota bacterium]
MLPPPPVTVIVVGCPGGIAICLGVASSGNARGLALGAGKGLAVGGAGKGLAVGGKGLGVPVGAL